MESNPLLYQIALTLIPKVGDVTGKQLVAYCGGVENVFKEKKKALMKIPGVGDVISDALKSIEIFKRAEEELTFVDKHKIKTLFYLDADYPKRLTFCHDSPMLLYTKGTTDFNKQKVLAVVGTRNATDYGKAICKQLIEGLSLHDVLIVSGLAYGVDIAAHKAALEYGTDTVAVLAHGLDTLYPALHKDTARKIIENGALVSDYPSRTSPDRENFPSRNRIIAGMADAVLVVEAALKGGALITAYIGNSYNREILAIPGRVGDKYSEGCNKLIRDNIAHIISSVEDIENLMNWGKNEKRKTPVQRKLFLDLSDDEKALVDILEGAGGLMDLDNLSLKSKMTASKVASVLLNLEFEGVVKAQPGRIFALV